jgi:hypothetical protein
MSNPKYRKLSIDDVGAEAWAAYERAKAAYKVYAGLKQEAEELARAQLPSLPDHVAYVFTYNYGNWSVFLGEPKAQPAKRAVGSLEDWIVQQNSAGRAI